MKICNKKSNLEIYYVKGLRFAMQTIFDPT